MTMTTDILTPLKLLLLCYPVIPSGGGREGKAPLVNWQQYQTEFPTDDDLERWEREFHPSLWGIVTGAMSGIVVDDLDFPSEGDPDFAAKAEQFKKNFQFHESLGLNPHIQTPRGGFHYWFRHPGNHVKTKAGLLPGIDIRGDGGFVNVIGKRKDGEYKTLIVPTPSTIYPWDKLPPVIADAIKADSNGPRKTEPSPAYSTESIPEGQRNHTLASKAGGMRAIGMSESEIESALQAFNLRNCNPPLSESEVTSIAKSVSRYPAGTGNSNTLNYMGGRGRENVSGGGQVSGQVVDNSEKGWGKFSEKFDEIMRGAGGEWVDREDIAGQLGTTKNANSLLTLIRRRRADNSIRVHSSRPSLIKWINRDYEVTDLEGGEGVFLPVKLPLGLHEMVKVPPGSVFGVAGYTSAGKTGFLLELAELNVLSQPMPVYYFYNEMSPDRFRNRCLDFPLLVQAKREKRFFPVEQKDFEIKDVVAPDSITIYDYLDRDEELFLIGRDIKEMRQNLGRGFLIFALQKPENRALGYGGLPSAKLSNLYVSLDKVEHRENATLGKITVVKCKDWVKSNPVGLYRKYLTGGYYGKLFLTPDDRGWQRNDL